MKHRIHSCLRVSNIKSRRTNKAASETMLNTTVTVFWFRWAHGKVKDLQSERRESPDPEAAGCCSEPGSVTAPLLPGGCWMWHVHCSKAPLSVPLACWILGHEEKRIKLSILKTLENGKLKNKTKIPTLDKSTDPTEAQQTEEGKHIQQVVGEYDFKMWYFCLCSGVFV